MGLALLEMVAVFGLCIFSIVVAVNDNALRPWTNWNDVHSNFGRIVQFPKILLPKEQFSRILGLWCIIPASSFCFFAFFAFGEEAIAEYYKYWRWVAVNILRRSDETNTSLPSYTT